MIDYLKNKFLEEAGDLLADLEASLLELEEHPGKTELINRIFRALHTLKGSGSMFGFFIVSQYTHGLETLYEQIRSNRIKINREIHDLTLNSVDVLRKIIYNYDENSEELHSQINYLAGKIREYTGLTEFDPFHEEISEQEGTESSGNDDQKEKLLHILFQPGKDILKTGNNPFYMLDEFLSMGEVNVTWINSGIPDLESMDVYLCYSSWDIEILTKASVEQIREVFLFIEEESIIQIDKIKIPEQVNQPAPAEAVRNPITDRKASTIRVSSTKLDNLMNMVSELVTLQARLELFSRQHNDHEISNLAENFDKLSRQLRDITFDICMVPLQTIVTRFQRMIRDLSFETGKEIQFVTEGTETELDKTIIENVTDPLLHIIRNSIDHGIESADLRTKRGKPAQGSIFLKAYQQGANVCVEISDDGGGIDKAKVLKRAYDNGLISEKSILSENEIYKLLFLPGFSTATNVTAISGRGVGLDVVKQNIMSLRGEIQVQSVPEKGTTFTLQLPLTLSIIDGLLVEVASERFILPLEFVRKIIVCNHEELVDAYNGLISYEKKKIPFYYLRQEFNFSAPLPLREEVVIVNYMGKNVGLAVDRVIGESQVVIKPLGKIFSSIHMFSGAAILGDGQLALVFDLHRMISNLSSSNGAIIN